MSPEVPVPNPPLSPEESRAFAKLTPMEVKGIDSAILSAAESRWNKSAMIIARVMKRFAAQYPEFSDVLYAERIRLLADQGRLDSQGDLSCPRFSEVKLPHEN